MESLRTCNDVPPAVSPSLPSPQRRAGLPSEWLLAGLPGSRYLQATAADRRERGPLTCWSTCTPPFKLCEVFSQGVLKIPQCLVEVVVSYVGGGEGKERAKTAGACARCASLEEGRLRQVTNDDTSHALRMVALQGNTTLVSYSRCKIVEVKQNIIN